MSAVRSVRGGVEREVWGSHLGSLLYAHILRRARSAPHDDADARRVVVAAAAAAAAARLALQEAKSAVFFRANLEQFSMRRRAALAEAGAGWPPFFCRRVEDL